MCVSSRHTSLPYSSETNYPTNITDPSISQTTGGMRVARVSIVDGSGAEVYDEFVRMDDGVEVM